MQTSTTTCLKAASTVTDGAKDHAYMSTTTSMISPCNNIECALSCSVLGRELAMGIVDFRCTTYIIKGNLKSQLKHSLITHIVQKAIKET